MITSTQYTDPRTGAVLQARLDRPRLSHNAVPTIFACSTSSVPREPPLAEPPQTSVNTLGGASYLVKFQSEAPFLAKCLPSINNVAFEVPKYHKLLHASIPAEVFQVHCSGVVPSIHTRWLLVFEIRPLNMQGEEIGGPYSLVGTDRWPIGPTLLLLACFTMTVVEVAHQNRVVTTEQERWGRKLEASRSRVVRV